MKAKFKNLFYYLYRQYANFGAVALKYRRQPARDTFGLVDAYVIKMYPLNHLQRWVSDYDLVYWKRWFSETKKNRAKKKFAKGFIEIKFVDAKMTSYE